jgi:hypothetical protein
MNWIDALEASGYAVWVRESPSILAFTSILALHAMGLAIIVGLNVVVALRLLGFVPEIPVTKLKQLYPWMYVGFTINLLSGGSLMIANLRGELENWVFLTKLTLIALAMINMEIMRTRVFDNPALAGGGTLPRSARIFAISSLVLWTLAMITGRLTSYPYLVEAYVQKLIGG